MSVYFITGAGTDIGKTYVTALLVRHMKTAGRTVVALKPVASGMPPIDDEAFDSTDTAQLLQAQGEAVTLPAVEACSPWRFKAALSPDMAAEAEGRPLDLAPVLAWCRDRIADAPAGSTILIEGVGGLMSPMTTDALNLDVIKALKCPTVLVAGSYLGAINHALAALETLKAHGADVEAVVLSESQGSEVDFDATLGTLRRFYRGAIIPLRRGALSLALSLD